MERQDSARPGWSWLDASIATRLSNIWLAICWFPVVTNQFGYIDVVSWLKPSRSVPDEGATTPWAEAALVTSRLASPLSARSRRCMSILFAHRPGVPEHVDCAGGYYSI